MCIDLNRFKILDELFFFHPLLIQQTRVKFDPRDLPIKSHTFSDERISLLK